MNQIAQFRYVKDPKREGGYEKLNMPGNLTRSQLETGSVFKSYYPIKKLIIDGSPSITFEINYGAPISNSSVGHFSLDLTNYDGIRDLKFDNLSQNIVNENNPLTITIEYEV